MTTQIAVRLPDDLVAFLDRSVADGLASSRAEIVSSALEREMRRRFAAHDASILRTRGAEDELYPVVAWTSHAIDLDD